MKAALPLLLAASLAGVVGGGGVAILLSGSAPEGGAASPAEEARTQRLGTQVEALQQGIDSLQGQVRQLELAFLTLSQRDDGTASLEREAEVLAVPRADEAAMLAAPGDDAAVDEVLTARVAEVIADLRAAEELEREQRREEMRAQMLEERLTQLTEQLGLDAYQAGKMRETLTAEAEKRDQIFRDARENGTWGEMRGAMDELRTSTRQGLETFLTSGQLETWDSLPTMGFGGRGGRFGGPGAGGPGGDGF